MFLLDYSRAVLDVIKEFVLSISWKFAAKYQKILLGQIIIFKKEKYDKKRPIFLLYAFTKIPIKRTVKRENEKNRLHVHLQITDRNILSIFDIIL
jgi:hypothetical protein